MSYTYKMKQGYRRLNVLNVDTSAGGLLTCPYSFCPCLASLRRGLGLCLDRIEFSWAIVDKAPARLCLVNVSVGRACSPSITPSLASGNQSADLSC